MKTISDEECVKQLRKKCKEVSISGKARSSSTRKTASRLTTRKSTSASGSGYAVKSTVGTVLESPSSEVRAEELVRSNSTGRRRSIIGDEENDKAIMNRVYIKSSKYAIGWILDSEVNKCMSCSVGFGIFTRKHHCRQCGDIVCHSCSKQKLQLSTLDENGGSRVCIKCMEIMYQDALMRRQKMNRKVYFSNIPSKPMLENSKQVQSANAAGHDTNRDGNNNDKNKAKRRTSYIERTYRMFSPEKDVPNASDLFRIDDVYEAPPVEISIDNPQPLSLPDSSVSGAGVLRSRDDVIKAALLHGVWEGSENGESTNPNSPLFSTTGENTPIIAGNAVEGQNKQQQQQQQQQPTSNQEYEKENSQLYESTFETPTKILQRRTLDRVTHALTNGIWEADEDGSISIASSDSPLSSSSSIKKGGSSEFKENNPKSNVSTPVSINMGSYVLQEGYLERRVSSDDVWSKEKYKLLSSGMLTCENNGNMNQIDMKYANVHGHRNNSGSKKKVDSRRQYLIEINHGDEKIILACATADEQVGWVASLMAFNAGNKKVLSAKGSSSVNIQNNLITTTADVTNGQQLVEKAILNSHAGGSHVAAAL